MCEPARAGRAVLPRRRAAAPQARAGASRGAGRGRGVGLCAAGWTRVLASLEGRAGGPRLPRINGLNAAALAAGGHARVDPARFGPWRDNHHWHSLWEKPPRWDEEQEEEEAQGRRCECLAVVARLLTRSAATLTALDLSCAAPLPRTRPLSSHTLQAPAPAACPSHCTPPALAVLSRRLMALASPPLPKPAPLSTPLGALTPRDRTPRAPGGPTAPRATPPHSPRPSRASRASAPSTLATAPARASPTGAAAAAARAAARGAGCVRRARAPPCSVRLGPCRAWRTWT